MTISTQEVVRLARLGRKAEQRKKARNGCLASLAFAVINALIGGWAFMLGVGVVHHEWIRQCPTIGYQWAVLISAAFGAALVAAQSRPATGSKGGV